MQLVSDLTGAKIDRPKNMEMTSVGAAFLGGLAVGRLSLLIYSQGDRVYFLFTMAVATIEADEAIASSVFSFFFFFFFLINFTDLE